MSYVIAAPEMMTAAATDLATIGANLSAAHAAAAPTLAVLPAAADEVSVSIAHLFSQHAQHYQAQAGHAAAFEERFLQHLTASAASFTSAEAANVSLLQPLTASAASFTSAIANLLGQIHDLLNSAVAALGQLLGQILDLLISAIATLDQLLNSLAGFLLPLIREAIAFSTAFFFAFVLPALNLVLSFLVII